MGAGDNGKAREKKPFPFSLFPFPIVPRALSMFRSPSGSHCGGESVLGGSS